jgi:5S rRNA maturation endonuclease (ribonuclease M5)
MSINRQMRHTKRNRCPVCGGADEDTRGKEKRCHGWTTDDGDWCHCSREELAGSIDAGPDGCFAHRMHGPCRCGMTHGEAKSGATMRDDIEAMYDYKDERGTLLFQVVRKSGKRFLQRRPDGDGWIWQTSGIRRVLFRLPELTADTTKPVYIVEGERDVETLERAGYLATTNPGGAGKWHFVAEMARQTLAGRDVVVIADADGPGREHAKAVADSLTGHASSVRVVEPVSAKDVTDYLEAGGNLDELLYQPPKPSPAQELAPELPFDDIWTKEPDVSLVIPGLGICPGPAHLVTGSWYTGKTLFLMAMGFAVASGRPLFGLHFVKKGRWTHFDHEMGRRGAKRYMQRVQAGLGIPAEEMRGNISLRVLPRLNLCTANAVEMYCELLAGSASGRARAR